MRTLTWNQQRALEILSTYGEHGTSLGNIKESSWGLRPYLCGSAGRSATLALEKRGLAEIHHLSAPRIYRITQAGKDALNPSPQTRLVGEDET